LQQLLEQALHLRIELAASENYIAAGALRGGEFLLVDMRAEGDDHPWRMVQSF
jgi:hypothetical protein